MGELVYPFSEIGKNIAGFPLNVTTASHVGVAPHTQFSCLTDAIAPCRPWFLHFQARHKEDLKQVMAFWRDERLWFTHLFNVTLDAATMRVAYKPEPLTCYAVP